MPLDNPQASTDLLLKLFKTQHVRHALEANKGKGLDWLIQHDYVEITRDENSFHRLFVGLTQKGLDTAAMLMKNSNDPEDHFASIEGIAAGTSDQAPAASPEVELLEGINYEARDLIAIEIAKDTWRHYITVRENAYEPPFEMIAREAFNMADALFREIIRRNPEE